jgi:hypothetical protein
MPKPISIEPPLKPPKLIKRTDGNFMRLGAGSDSLAIASITVQPLVIAAKISVPN